MLYDLKPEDQDDLEYFLNHYPETSMFMRSNLRAAGLTYSGKNFEGEYIGYKTDTLEGVIVHYWNGNVMMQAPDKNVLQALCEQFIKQCTRPVAGVLGDDHQAQFVIHTLDLNNEYFAVNYSEKLYQLKISNMSIPVIPADATLLEARKCDESVLYSWFEGYYIEALGADPKNKNFPEQIHQAVTETKEGQNRWILTVNREPVSLCGFNSELPDMVQLGPVWTPPEFRNKGYARQIVALCLQQAMALGVNTALLFTNNPPACRAYEAIGFKHIGAYRLAICKSPISIKH